MDQLVQSVDVVEAALASALAAAAKAGQWQTVETLALIALEERDPSTGVSFATFAEHWIRNEIQRWIDVGVYWRPVDVEALPPLRRPRWQTARPTLHRNEAEREAFVIALADGASGLTEKERKALTAVFVEGRPMRAAAAHLGVPFPTLRARVQMARATLRIWLARADGK